MGVNFEIIGKLKAIKDSDKFSAMELRDYSSGWQTTRYRFNVISGTNRIMCEISGGKWQDDSKNKIYAMSRATSDKKSEKIIIDWGKRNDPETIAKVAGWRIYTMGLTTESGDNHNFLDRTDYAEFVKGIIDGGEYKDTKFKIMGTVDYQYSAKDGRYYSTMSVNKIYRVNDDTPDKAEMTIDAYYTEDAFNMESYEDKGRCYFSCYTDYYFSNIKARKFVPLTLVIKKESDTDNRAKKFQKRLDVFEDEEVRKVSFLCKIINGSEVEPITMDDLTPEQREDIEDGLTTLDDIQKAYGGGKMGDYSTEYRIVKFAKDSTTHGSESTIYTIDNLKELPVVNVNANDNEDIFDEEI